MAGFLVRRVLYGILILIGVNLLTFVLFFTVSTPDDMARLNIGGKYISQQQIDDWKVAHGYDKPLLWNAKDDGSRKLTDTVFWQRSARLFALDFGASDTGRDIGHEIAERIGPSIALQAPVFALTIFVSVVFSLAMVFFRGSPLDFWGVVLTVVLLSISSLFYIIAGQYVFSKLMRVVPISGFADGLGLVKFLVAADPHHASCRDSATTRGCIARCSSRSSRATTCGRRGRRGCPSRSCCSSTCCATR